MSVLARITSFVFHPLLMATYLIGLFSFQYPVALYPIKSDSNLSFLGLLFLLTFALPAINIGFLRIFGIISSLSLEDRAERTKPFLIILTLYGLFTYLLYTKTRLSMGDNLFSLILIIDALVLVSVLITIMYKASIHSLAIWGVIGILFPLNKVTEDGSLFLPTLIALVLAGIIMSARLYLNAHTPREVLVGSVIGFSVGFFGMLILF